MAKPTAKMRGKHPLKPQRGSDGRFLPGRPNPPGSPLRLALEQLPQPGQEVVGTPIHPGGLEYLDSSSSDHIYTVNLHPDTDNEQDNARTEASPSHDTLPLLSVPGRNNSMEQLVTPLRYVPVTVESVTDEDHAARRRSRQTPISLVIRGNYQEEQVHGYSNLYTNTAPASVHSRDRAQSRALVLWKFAPEMCSTGSSDIERMLNQTQRSPTLSRSAQNRAPSSIECDLRGYAEQAEERTQAALDLNHRALGLLMESIENTKQARVDAIRARQRVEDLLSVSSHHRERMCSQQHTENESIDHAIHEACDQHRRQADYEHRLRSNILTTEEHQEIKPSPVSSILLESRDISTAVSRNADGGPGSQDLGASISVPKSTPPRSPGPINPGRMGVDDWVQYTQQHPPPPPADDHVFPGTNPSGTHRPGAASYW
jgi:hypothetical protein